MERAGETEGESSLRSGPSAFAAEVEHVLPPCASQEHPLAENAERKSSGAANLEGEAKARGTCDVKLRGDNVGVARVAEVVLLRPTIAEGVAAQHGSAPAPPVQERSTKTHQELGQIVLPDLDDARLKRVVPRTRIRLLSGLLERQPKRAAPKKRISFPSSKQSERSKASLLLDVPILDGSDDSNDEE